MVEKKAKGKGKLQAEKKAKPGKVEKAKVKAEKEPVQKPEKEPVSKPENKKTELKKEKMNIIQTIEKNYLIISAALFIVVLVAGMFLIPGQEEASVQDFWDKKDVVSEEKGTVRMIIITSENCPGCEVNNSFEVLFNKNGIDFATNQFSEIEEDGKNLIQVTGIKKLPAFVIEEESLSEKMIVKTSSGSAPLKDVLHFYVDEGKGSYKEGIFAFPEIELDGVLRPRILLGETCGTKDNILVQWFADPYDPNTISRSKDFENIRLALEAEKPFDVNSYFWYRYLPTYSLVLEEEYLKAFGGKRETVKNNLQGPAKYLMCASDVFGTKKFIELQHALYSTYCEIDANTMAGTDIRGLLECSDSNHFNVFLTGEETIEAAKKAGVYGDMVFNACLLSIDEKLPEIELIAKAAGIERTPKLLINCEYEVPMINSFDALCTLNPELGFCPK